MKKYSKKSNNILVISIFILIAVLVISSSFLIYIYTQNYIKVERIDNRSSNQKTDTIKAARPIYINNLLLGGVDSKKWISGSSMYSVATNVKEEEVDLYDLTSKIGTYMVTAVNKELKTKQVYIKTDRILNVEEYIAVPTDLNKNMNGQVSISDATDNDKKTVKKALGIYSMLNNTVKINEVYIVTLKSGETGRLIFTTSDGKNKFGVYSAIVFATEKKATIVKYNYVKNIKSSVDWPVYSLKFVYDLNSDNVAEIVLQETTEYNIKYTVMEYRNNKFYEVLSEKIKI